jgi:hypothetical protein
MKATAKLVATMFVGIPLAGVAQESKLTCVNDVTYNQEFLAKFPKAGAACQEVKLTNGQKWIRFNAEVKQNADNRLTVNFLDNLQQKPVGNAMTFEYTPDATLTLENKQVKQATQVRKGDKVMVWVPESRFGLYAKPGAIDSEHFALVTDQSAKQR